MRCEICGVPVGEGIVRCERCVERSSKPPRPSVGVRTLGFDEKKPSVRPLPANASPEALALANKERMGEASPVVLENKYRLLDEIGRGAMGTVFLAEDMSLKRKVAIKFLLPELDASVDYAIRFKQEAVGMASVRHNNVAQIYSYAEHGGTLYFVMEYLDGESIENLIDANNRRGFFVPLEDALDILIQALNGLSAIHRAGQVHRDIKPGNIMLTDSGQRTVIMDFGLVRNVEIEQEMRTMIGTPAYIAPEIAEGRPGCDRSIQADIYSMGVSAYELLTGTLPFNGRTWVEIVRKHITEMPPVPSERRPGLPEKIDEVIFQMLSKDPNERQNSCEEILEDLYVIEKMVLPSDFHIRNGRSTVPPSEKRRYPSRGATLPPSMYRTSQPASGRGRLLVVDPDPEFRTKVHEVAKATVPGCRVFSATDGEMALKMLEESPPHLIVLELALPEMNGLELVATLRGDSIYDSTGIIVVSLTGGKKENEILKQMRINAYLTKPVDLEILADEIRPLLERPLSPRFTTPRPKSWI